MNQKSPFKTVESSTIWESRWYSLRQDKLEDEAGNAITYTVVDKPDAVWIVPVTTDGKLVLINQYRHPIAAWCLEVPSGNIEPDVEPAEMAARELKEEAGGIAQRLELVTFFYTMKGIGNEIALIFLALGVELGEPEREITEHILLEQVPVKDALQMARTGLIKDGPSALAILLCEAALGNYVTELES